MTAVRALFAAGALLGVAALAHAQPATAAASEAEPAYGPQLEGFDYARKVERFRVRSQQQDLKMAYIDAAPADPAKASGRVAVLLHGKNFCAGTWEGTIDALTQAGWRVIAPDQIGFCKSTKPPHYQYSFQQLARNTQALLASLGIGKATVIGHSTGGMLAIRYALMLPEQTQQLVLVSPIGLEDWKAKGVPSITVDQWLERERKTSAASIRAYEQSTYYVGQWQPAYERWVQMLAGLNNGPDKELVAWNSALLYDMIDTQPVVYELGQLAVPTVLLIGTRDTTAIGKDMAPPALRPQLGNYGRLGKRAAAAIPGARLIEFDDLGHAPQIQDPARFHRALLEALSPTP